MLGDMVHWPGGIEGKDLNAHGPWRGEGQHTARAQRSSPGTAVAAGLGSPWAELQVWGEPQVCTLGEAEPHPVQEDTTAGLADTPFTSV